MALRRRVRRAARGDAVLIRATAIAIRAALRLLRRVRRRTILIPCAAVLIGPALRLHRTLGIPSLRGRRIALRGRPVGIAAVRPGAIGCAPLVRRRTLGCHSVPAVRLAIRLPLLRGWPGRGPLLGGTLPRGRLGLGLPLGRRLGTLARRWSAFRTRLGVLARGGRRAGRRGRTLLRRTLGPRTAMRRFAAAARAALVRAALGWATLGQEHRARGCARGLRQGQAWEHRAGEEDQSQQPHRNLVSDRADPNPMRGVWFRPGRSRLRQGVRRWGTAIMSGAMIRTATWSGLATLG